MAENLLATQVVPAPSIGPTLNLLSEIKQRQAQTALTEVQGARANALYNAYQSGNPNAIGAAGDYAGANAAMDLIKNQRAYGGWLQYGPAAARGDADAAARLAAVDPKSAELLAQVRQHNASTYSTLSGVERENSAAAAKRTAELGTGMLAVAAETDPQKRLSMLPNVEAAAQRAGVPPMMVAQYKALLNTPGGVDQWGAIARGMLAFGETAQAEAARGGFGKTEIPPDKQTLISGPARIAAGLPAVETAAGASDAAGAPPAGTGPLPGAGAIGTGPGATSPSVAATNRFDAAFNGPIGADAIAAARGALAAGQGALGTQGAPAPAALGGVPAAATGNAMLLGGSPAAVASAKGLAEAGVALQKKAAEDAADAQTVRVGLETLDKDLRAFGGGGDFLAPGTGARERVEIAKAINTALSSLNVAPVFDPTRIAAAESANKGTTRLGFDLARTLGSREAMQVVQQAIGVTPGIENTPQGNRRIVASLMQGAQRTIDRNAFIQNFKGDKLQADIAFNAKNPPELYVKRAVLDSLPGDGKAAIAFLKAHPDTAAAFDTHYGVPGLAAVALAPESK